MPLYTYVCQSCGHQHDEHRTVADRDDIVRCPKCKLHDLRRVPTVAGFIITGFNAKNGYTKQE